MRGNRRPTSNASSLSSRCSAVNDGEMEGGVDGVCHDRQPDEGRRVAEANLRRGEYRPKQSNSLSRGHAPRAGRSSSVTRRVMFSVPETARRRPLSLKLTTLVGSVSDRSFG